MIEDDFEMSLEISDSGTPYLLMHSYGKLIFSKTLKHSLGYKWLCYVRRYIDVSVTKNSAGDRSVFKVPEIDAIMYNFKLYRDSEDARGIKRGTIPAKVQKWLRKNFEDLGVEKDGILYFPESQLSVLKDRIENTNFNRMVKPRKTRKKGGKRGRPKKNAE